MVSGMELSVWGVIKGLCKHAASLSFDMSILGEPVMNISGEKEVLFHVMCFTAGIQEEV